MTIEEKEAFDTLLALANKTRQIARQLPEQIDSISEWTGVGFSLMGVNLVVPMQSLAEMIDVPPCTKLPGVQGWVKGIASVRGRLLPVFDLAAYFGEQLTAVKKQQRLLVLENHAIYAGLQVDQVYGVVHFPEDARTQSVETSLPDVLIPYIVGAFEANERHWFMFDLGAIVQEQRFMNVATEL